MEDDDEGTDNGELHCSSDKRLYVKNLELCPVKVTVSSISSLTLPASGRSRFIIWALLAILWNVQNAVFRFNSFGLQRVSVAHFQSLISESYIPQRSSQVMIFLASNSLIALSPRIIVVVREQVEKFESYSYFKSFGWRESACNSHIYRRPQYAWTYNCSWGTFCSGNVRWVYFGLPYYLYRLASLSHELA